jgi:hypothetical protein
MKRIAPILWGLAVMMTIVAQGQSTYGANSDNTRYISQHPGTDASVIIPWNFRSQGR